MSAGRLRARTGRSVGIHGLAAALLLGVPSASVAADHRPEASAPPPSASPTVEIGAVEAVRFVGTTALVAHVQRAVEGRRVLLGQCWPSSASTEGTLTARLLMVDGLVERAWFDRSAKVPAEVRACVNSVLSNLDIHLTIKAGRGTIPARGAGGVWDLLVPMTFHSSPIGASSTTGSSTASSPGPSAASSTGSSSGSSPAATDSGSPDATPAETVAGPILPPSACSEECNATPSAETIAVFQRRFTAAGDCLKRGALPGERVPMPSGVLEVEVTVAPDGSVCGVQTPADPFGRPSTTACVASAVSDPMPVEVHGTECTRLRTRFRFVGR